MHSLQKDAALKWKVQMSKLVSRSSELGAQNGSLRRKLAVLEQLYAALAKRNHACQKVIQTLVGLSSVAIQSRAGVNVSSLFVQYGQLPRQQTRANKLHER